MTWVILEGPAITCLLKQLKMSHKTLNDVHPSSGFFPGSRFNNTSGLPSTVLLSQGPIIAYVRNVDPRSIEFVLTGDLTGDLRPSGRRNARPTTPTPSVLLHRILSVDCQGKVAGCLRAALSDRLSREFECESNTIAALVTNVRKLADMGYSERMAEIFQDVPLLSSHSAPVDGVLRLCPTCDELLETPDCHLCPAAHTRLAPLSPAQPTGDLEFLANVACDVPLTLPTSRNPFGDLEERETQAEQERSKTEQGRLTRETFLQESLVDELGDQWAEEQQRRVNERYAQEKRKVPEQKRNVPGQKQRPAPLKTVPRPKRVRQQPPQGVAPTERLKGRTKRARCSPLGGNTDSQTVAGRLYTSLHRKAELV